MIDIVDQLRKHPESTGWTQVAADEIELLRAKLASLNDPTEVYLNMLQGIIAKPSWDSMKRFYAADLEVDLADVERLKSALNVALVAVDDWLHTYAPDMCRADDVSDTNKRIGEFGTLYYIGNVADVIRKALSNTLHEHERTLTSNELSDLHKDAIETSVNMKRIIRKGREMTTETIS